MPVLSRRCRGNLMCVSGVGLLHQALFAGTAVFATLCSLEMAVALPGRCLPQQSELACRRNRTG